MKSGLFLLICAVILINFSQAQTFNGTGGPIPDSGSVQGIYPINVNGIGNINNNFGLLSVCVNIIHPWVSDLEIYLRAPDGTMIPLSIQNGGSGNDYTGTCFLATATVPLENGIAPFNGNYIPDGYMGAVNNGQNADGIWNLYIKDVSSGQTGTLINWSVSFSDALPPAPPACNGNQPPANTCAEATPICSFSGFCASTSSLFTADSWPELDIAFCGTVQNNAFVKFVAAGTYMNFSIWVISSVNHDGIQMLFYDGGCGSGPVTEYGCYSPIRPGSSPNIISATGLTPGNTYYLMIDGFAGDECNYVIELYPPVGGLAVTTSSPDVCAGNSVQLIASGGNGIYSWFGPGLSANIGSIVTAAPLSTSTYTVSSIDPGGLCQVSKQVSIHVNNLPDPPTATDIISYCQGSIAAPLTATGTNLLWYYTAMGGTGSSVPIIPATSNAGITTYYVSQATNCESERTAINVRIKEKPFLGNDKYRTVCDGKTADLTTEFDSRNMFAIWSLNNEAIDPPHTAAISGNYQFEVINDEGCSDTALVHFSVQPPMHVSIDSDTLAIKGIPFRLHCTRAVTYSWSPSDLLNFSNIQEPLATITGDQQFIVQVTDAAGCPGIDSIFIKIYNGNTYYIPNAFSPNGDGINDIFRAVPMGIDKTIIFRVWNRYGKIIFESTDPFKKGWDGKYMGVTQSPGTYVWFIKGIDKNKKTVEMSGSVILVL